MNEQRDLSGELAAANGIAQDALREVRMEQSRAVVAAEQRKASRWRFISIAAWATTLIVIFGSMWMAVAFIFGVSDAGTPPRAGLMVLTILSMLGMFAFVVAVVASVAWYFSARTASLKGIDARLGQLEAMLTAEVRRESGSDPRREVT